MNNDLYYLKYLKYKTKYLNEKNKIEGGSFFHSCDSTIIFNNLKQIDTFQYIEDLIKNIFEGTIDSIIALVKKIYENTVFPLMHLDKECLAPELNKYLQTTQKILKFKLSDLDNSEHIITFPLGTEFPKLIHTSYNIREEYNDYFIQEIVEDGKFSKGTAFINSFFKKDSFEKFKRNSRFLTNLMNIRFSIDSTTYVESLRFGTPYEPKENSNFYPTQIKILKEYVKEKKCLFISFLDLCDSFLCRKKLVGEKIEENIIVNEEIKGYINYNFAYLNMACNNSVNLKSFLSTVSDEYQKEAIYNHLTKLETWTKKANGSDILEKLRNNGNFFEKFKKNVADNDSTDTELVSRLSIRKFVLIKKPKNKEQLSNFDDHMKQFSPCEEDLTNEHIRLVMFCYISLIFYILSRNNPNEYILLYHCKSGQDRTGTFYAINQMVNKITTEKYDDIVRQIMAGTSFIDIFYEFYSLTKQITTISQEKKYCPQNNIKELLSENTQDKNINKNVELYYLRFLLFSYMMTLTSTGCPGLKWGLTNKQFFLKGFDKRPYDTDSAIDNRFPYLLLSKPEYALELEGASKMRGS